MDFHQDRYSHPTAATRSSFRRTGRLHLLCTVLFLAFASVSSAQAEFIRLRLTAANLTSGNYQSYDLGHGTRILQGLRPDVAFVQEFNYRTNSASDIRSWVDTAFGSSFSYYREAGAQIPNGIVSRYPILASGEWDDPRVTNRDFAWARIDIPGPIDLWAVSVHLLTTSATERNLEASSLVSFIRANIPAGDFLAIGGDFNTGSRNESAFSTLSQVVHTAGPYPVDQNGNGGTNAGRNRPYDGIYADSDLHAFASGVVIGNHTFANGLVFDSRVFTPLSSVSPVLQTDSGAPSMQHMAVVRDFLIPVPEPGSVLLLIFSVATVAGTSRWRRSQGAGCE